MKFQNIIICILGTLGSNTVGWKVVKRKVQLILLAENPLDLHRELSGSIRSWASKDSKVGPPMEPVRTRLQSWGASRAFRQKWRPEYSGISSCQLVEKMQQSIETSKQALCQRRKWKWKSPETSEQALHRQIWLSSLPFSFFFNREDVCAPEKAAA